MVSEQHMSTQSIVVATDMIKTVSDSLKIVSI
ncbi:hypothetical protein FVEG_11288 [Fusarium verticillioides 7600]|uniref:Uncharacterized protein n=1 Tax=Gibberella moniliformis (strain M3125 / FGSC 7600) TaxID=334819 RepID=W7MNC4_GIBM7|nr:hypothetical protein FVEG_11288 [Fusarium verticillioides 7600]EWG52571.1 hypothetical protein FVEG_11288 [Fusarium verticillioides 7600]